jgi:hypothetical protein
MCVLFSSRHVAQHQWSVLLELMMITPPIVRFRLIGPRQTRRTRTGTGSSGKFGCRPSNRGGRDMNVLPQTITTTSPDRQTDEKRAQVIFYESDFCSFLANQRHNHRITPSDTKTQQRHLFSTKVVTTCITTATTAGGGSWPINRCGRNRLSVGADHVRLYVRLLRHRYYRDG